MIHADANPPDPGSPTRSLPRRARSALPAVVVTAAAVAGSTGACSDTEPAGYQAPRGASRVITGLGTEITSDGRRVLHIEADSGFADMGPGVLTLIGVEARTFDEDGTVRVTLDADSGRLDEATRVFTATGSVRMRALDGTISLETAELSYDPSTGRLRTDSAVVVTRQGRTEQGSCFEGDPLLTTWQVCGSAP